ncbi:MAG TPA: fibronectin type III domain-containing protein [Armatimonadota bacterium]|nr:fibronectin type III domain-containing protein [Armatimonadota bacterium]
MTRSLRASRLLGAILLLVALLTLFVTRSLPVTAAIDAPTDVHVTLLDNSGEPCQEKDPPKLTPPPDVTICWPAPGLQPGVPTVSTHCPLVSVSVTRSDGRPLNDPFPAGVTTIVWTVTNKAGTATCSQNIDLVQILVHGPASLPVGQTGIFTVTLGGASSLSTASGLGPYHWESSDPVDAPIDHTSDNPAGLSQSARIIPLHASPGPVTVTATDSNGCSGSAFLMVKAAPPAPPTLSGMCVGGNRIDLTWQPGDNTQTGFELQRSSGNGGFATLSGSLGASATSYQDSSVAAGGAYTYQVRALSPGGPSAYSNAVVVKLIGPAAPTNLAATCLGSTGVHLGWTNNANNATGILIKRSLDDINYTTIAQLPANATSYGDHGLVPGVTYYYSVSPWNACGTSSANAMAHPVQAPTNLRARCALFPNGTIAIRLDWDDNDAAVRWIVRRFDAAGRLIAELPTAGRAPHTYYDTGLLANTTYTYRVLTVDPCGVSDSSNAAVATTRPAAARFLTATNINETDIRLEWQDVNIPAPLGWQLGRTSREGNSVEAKAEIIPAAHGPFYEDGDVRPGVTYTYTVKPYNSCGAATSVSVVAMTPAVEYAPLRGGPRRRTAAGIEPNPLYLPITVDHVVPTLNSLAPRPDGTYDIHASPGESMIFNIIHAEDWDLRRRIGTLPWTKIRGTGPYTIVMKCSAGASFGNIRASTGVRQVTRNGLTSGNVYLWIDPRWIGIRSLAVTATITDAGLRIFPPNRGSTADVPVNIYWRITLRSQPCPNSMRQVNPPPNPGWVQILPPDASAVYHYEFLPGPPGRYEGDTILETFDPPVPLNFGLADLTPGWRMQNPLATTPASAARALFSGSANGTFVIDANNQIHDGFRGFGPHFAFTRAALMRGVEWRTLQYYRCGGTIIGRYYIDRRFIATSFNPDGSVKDYQIWMRRTPAP